MANTIKVTREQIFKELWDTDAVRLCKKFDISLETLNQACKKHNIPMPYENYEIEKKTEIRLYQICLLTILMNSHYLRYASIGVLTTQDTKANQAYCVC